LFGILKSRNWLRNSKLTLTLKGDYNQYQAQLFIVLIGPEIVPQMKLKMKLVTPPLTNNRLICPLGKAVLVFEKYQRRKTIKMRVSHVKPRKRYQKAR
jgi:hypothetical protein